MSTRGASAIQRVDWDTVNLLRPFFDKGPDPIGARLLDLSMLRGAWVASVDSGGDWYDISGHGHTLTYNGNPTFNYDGLVPYWDLDGTGDLFRRPDEADLDITGLETYVAAAAQGLTLGGCFWWDDKSQAVTFWGKTAPTTNNRSYWLEYSPAVPGIRFFVSGNGIATVNASATSDISTFQWYFVAGRYTTASTEVALFVDDAQFTNPAGPASIFPGNADLAFGNRSDIGFYHDGRGAFLFLCAAALSDTQINVFYHMTKRYFGH